MSERRPPTCRPCPRRWPFIGVYERIREFDPLESAREYLRRPLYRETGFLMGNTLLKAGTGFFFWLIAARLTNPTEIGLATSIVSAITIVALLSRFGIDMGLAQALPPLSDSKRNAAVFTAIIFMATAAALGSVVFALGSPIWSPQLSFLSSSFLLLGAFVLLTVSQSLFTATESVLIGLSRAKWVFVLSVVYQSLRVGALIGLGILGLVAAEVVVASFYGPNLVHIGLAVAVILPLLGLRPFSSRDFDLDTLQEYLRGAVVNSSPSLLKRVPLTVGTLVVLNRFGPSESGLFYILWLFGSIALFAPSAFEWTSLVRFAEGGRIGRSVLVRGAVISLVTGSAVILVGSLLLPFFGTFYAALGIRPLIPFALSTVPALFLQTRFSELRTKKSYGLLTFSLSVVLAVFLVSLTLLPIGVRNAGWLWFGALSVGALIVYVPRFVDGSPPPLGAAEESQGQ